MGQFGDKTPYSLKGRRIWLAGHRGMVGQALLRRLDKEGCEILTANREDLDLTRQDDVEKWLETHRPDTIILAAAKVGGIQANNAFPVDFIYENLMIEANVIRGAHKIGVEKLLFIGSSCAYPKMAPQPIREESLLTGEPEPTNQWYSVAKIAGIKMCQAFRQQYGADFISVIPTNLYGPNDDFDLETSHVGSALLVKAHNAKMSGANEIEIWGTGQPLRELMYVEDCADGLVFLLKNYSASEPVNLGCGQETTITDLARVVADVVGFAGEFVFDRSKPDGAPRKALDGSKIKAMGWKAKTPLQNGMTLTYEWFLKEN